MKLTEATEIIKEIIPLDLSVLIMMREELASALIYAYDKGWEEGQQDLHKEQSRMNK